MSPVVPGFRIDESGVEVWEESCGKKVVELLLVEVMFTVVDPFWLICELGISTLRCTHPVWLGTQSQQQAVLLEHVINAY